MTKRNTGRNAQTRVEPHLERGKGARPSAKRELRVSAEDRIGGSAGATTRAKPRRGGRGSGRGEGRSRRRRGGVLRRAIYGIVFLGLWAVIAVGGVLGYYAYKLPRLADLEVPARPPAILVLANDGAELAQRGQMRGMAVGLRELPPYLAQAVIATEDARFYSHFGVDPIGLMRAALANFNAGGVVQGGSTLTQQLAKNLFLESERTMDRKLQEVILALWLEHRFSKDEILEMYLNRVFFGSGAHGVEAAAQAYFAKSAREVTLQEAATLAGLLKAPTRLAPNKHPEAAKERMEVVLARMVEEGFITRDEGRHAVRRPLEVARADASAVGYVADWVEELVGQHLGEIKEDVVVETTIDPVLQSQAEKSLVAAMRAQGKDLRAGQAALVAVDGIGAVRALVGGVSYRASQFNRAVKAKRQPGSAFKPFVYLAALERDISPEAVRIDAPTTYKNWSPSNYDGKFRGPMSIADALEGSINTVAVNLAAEAGPERVTSTARRLGITSELQDNLSIALGTSEVTLLELTGAYVPFANGGHGVVPHVVDRIRTASGKLLYERTGEGPGTVVASRDVAAMNHMLARVVTGGTGRRAQIDGWPAAGKTGTSQESRDAWFVGYTANLTAGVWVGNDDSSPMKKVTGGSLPAEIWRDFMSSAHRGVAVASLPGDYNPAEYGAASEVVEVDESLPWLKDQAPASAPVAAVAQRRYAQPEQPSSGFPINAGFLKRLFSGMPVRIGG
jgi:penicillin-binding protein 1A